MLTGGNVKQYDHCGKQCGSSSRIKCKIYLIPQFHSQVGRYPKELKKHVHTKICAPCLYSIIHRSQNVKIAPVSMNSEWGNKIWRVHIMEYYSAINLEELIGSNMDEPWKHYGK